MWDPGELITETRSANDTKPHISNKRFITQRAENNLEEVLLELPTDQTVGELIPEIANPDGTGVISIVGEERIADLAYPTWSPQGWLVTFTKGGPSGSNAIYLVEIPSGIER